MKKYIPSEIESKWQKKWAEDKLSHTDLSNYKNKYYCLVELPYTSGALHIGHWFTFSKGDILSRFKKMQGYNVIFPNGYDTFGLPAENAAIKNNMHPKKWTDANIEKMRQQFETMGTMIDWEKSAATYDPGYYKWNQWIFLKMLEKRIAYRGQTISNWCPSCQTVLADENVEAGTCWRCHSQVEKKEVPQWFLKITEYADRLIWQDPPQADWPKALTEAQNKWIGKSVGVELEFLAKDSEKIKVYTTRPDTLFGVSFIVISPEHSLLNELVTQDHKDEVTRYVDEALKKSEQERKENKEKSGVFTGNYVLHPLTSESIPVWVSDYVLAGYGTGAVMGVPAHDERDFEFATKHNLPIKQVIEPLFIQNYEPGAYREGEAVVPRESVIAIVKHWTDEKFLCLKWKQVAWKTFLTGGIEKGQTAEKASLDEIKQETGYLHPKFIKEVGIVHGLFYHVPKKENRLVKGHVVYLELEDGEKDNVSEEESRLHDLEWMNLEELNKSLTPDTHKYALEIFKDGIKFYEDEGYLINSGEYDGLSSSEAREKITKYLTSNHIGSEQVQYHLHDWSISRQRYWGTPIPIIYCDKCGVVPVPEEDLPVTLPDEVDYTPTGKPPLALNEAWVNVKCPKCGGEGKREVETMDGFIDNSWYFYRYLDPKNDKEIFDASIIKNWMPVDIYIGGSEHTYGHALYSRFFTEFFKDLGLVDFAEYTKRRVHHGVILGPDGSRMSKSRGNVVDPDIEAANFGADAVRVYLNFIGPYDVVGPWVPEGLQGSYHFLQRVWGLQEKVISRQSSVVSSDGLRVMHRTIKKVTEDLEDLANNTAIAALMEWLNYLSRQSSVVSSQYKIFLLLLSPIAPHITEELWSLMGEEYSIHQQSWPNFDNKYLEDEEVTVVIQINGKVRDNMVINRAEIDQKEAVVKKALGSEKIQKWLEGKDPLKEIYVPGKVLNLVV